ncbi:MAG: hypothetical protein ABS949_10935 [Solibacillus sp.]
MIEQKKIEELTVAEFKKLYTELNGGMYSINQINELSNSAQKNRAIEYKIEELKNKNISTARYWKKISKIFKLNISFKNNLETLKEIKEYHTLEEIRYMRRILEKQVMQNQNSTTYNLLVFVTYVTLLITVTFNFALKIFEDANGLIEIFKDIIFLVLGVHLAGFGVVYNYLRRDGNVKLYLTWVESIEDLYDEDVNTKDNKINR